MFTPLDLLLDPVSLTIFGMFAGLWLYESLRPGRPLPVAPGARLRGLVGFFIFFFLSSYLPLVWDETLARLRWFDLTTLALGVQAGLGVLVYELLAYGYHRALHSSDVLFRVLHQTHHSSERLDVASAFYFHPLDMVGWTAVTSFSLVLVVGLSPEATTITLLSINALSMFQHTNIKTPRWLGYLVQRPESHSLHHGRGRHRNNYADLPLLDLLFGTFENPSEFAEETGFYDGASAEIGPLLIGRDLSARRAAQRGVPPMPIDRRDAPADLPLSRRFL